jgi:hypothetical protein
MAQQDYDVAEQRGRHLESTPGPTTQTGTWTGYGAHWQRPNRWHAAR